MGKKKSKSKTNNDIPIGVLFSNPAEIRLIMDAVLLRQNDLNRTRVTAQYRVDSCKSRASQSMPMGKELLRQYENQLADIDGWLAACDSIIDTIATAVDVKPPPDPNYHNPLI